MIKAHNCKTCGIEATSENTGTYKDKYKGVVTVRFNSRCKSCTSVQTKQWKKKNPEKTRVANAKWQKENAEKYSQIAATHAKNNREKRTADTAKYRARKKNLTPFLTPVEEEWLQFYYDEAAYLSSSTGIPHDVDHVKPINKGGHHAPWNLQVLTASENRSKQDTWHLEAA